MNKDSQLHVSPVVRWIFFSLGVLFALIGLIGVILPILPTTPFMILAAASFARSSERFYQMLLQNKIFGPSIRDWHQYHCMALRIKVIAISLIVLACGISAYTLRGIEYGTVGMVIVMLLLVALMLRIPLCKHR